MDEIRIRETTTQEISGHSVGVGNIWERELPDADGVIAPRMSATVAIHDPATLKTRHEQVFAGSVITLGEDRYQIVNVDEGGGDRGTITMSKSS